MKIVYSTLEDCHNRGKAKDANIPEHAVVFARIGDKLYRLDEDLGVLRIQVEQQLVVRPGQNNSILVHEEKF